MLRAPAILRNIAVPPIATALRSYAAGKGPITPAGLVDFFASQNPQISSLPDYIYIHRLIQSFPQTDQSACTNILSSITSAFPGSFNDMSVYGLSVLISTLADSPNSTSALTEALTAITSKPLTAHDRNGRIIGRVCKGISNAGPADITRSMLEWVSVELSKSDTSLFTLKDVVRVWSAAGLRGISLPPGFVHYTSQIGSFFTPQSSVDMLTWIASATVTPAPGLAELVSRLKLNVLRANGVRSRMERSLGQHEVVLAVSALARVGALGGPDCKRLISRQKFGNLDHRTLSLLGQALFTAPTNTAIVADSDRLDPTLVKSITRAIREVLTHSAAWDIRTVVRAAHTACISSAGAEELLTNEFVGEIFSRALRQLPMSAENQASWCQLAELYVLRPDFTLLVSGQTELLQEKISEYITLETAMMMSDPLVQSVMAHFGTSTLTPMKDSECALPVLRVSEEVVVDIDCLWNACSRVVRSKIAEKYTLPKYKVIDSLSWSAFGGKTGNQLSEWMESESVFWCATPTQIGEDSKIRPREKSPHFAYVRRIDLK